MEGSACRPGKDRKKLSDHQGARNDHGGEISVRAIEYKNDPIITPMFSIALQRNIWCIYCHQCTVKTNTAFGDRILFLK